MWICNTFFSEIVRVAWLGGFYYLSRMGRVVEISATLRNFMMHAIYRLSFIESTSYEIRAIKENRGKSNSLQNFCFGFFLLTFTCLHNIVDTANITKLQDILTHFLTKIKKNRWFAHISEKSDKCSFLLPWNGRNWLFLHFSQSPALTLILNMSIVYPNSILNPMILTLFYRIYDIQ